jgi:vacuolar-type H+-ATPase subunit E/Vma4
MVENLQNDASKNTATAEDQERLEKLAKDDDWQDFQKTVKNIAVKNAGGKSIFNHGAEDLDSEWEKLDEQDAIEEYVVVELTRTK